MKYLVLLLALAACAPAEDGHVTAAHRSVSAQLRDPVSAQFSLERVQPSGAVCGFVNAKNGFGGYDGRTAFIAYPDGRTLLNVPPDPGAFVAAWRAEGCLT
jgi:hypothetical protein